MGKSSTVLFYFATDKWLHTEKNNSVNTQFQIVEGPFMKKKAILCLALSLTLLLFAAGCSRDDDNTTGTNDNNTNNNNTSDNVDNNTGNNADNTGNTTQPGEGNETASDNMSTLRGLIGRADDELVKAFGEGEAVVEDALTTGRRYTMNILGEDMPVHVALDENGNVVSANAELPDDDVERWNKTLTETFGDPETVDDRPQWVKDGTIYSIQKANDKLGLMITGQTT